MLQILVALAAHPPMQQFAPSKPWRKHSCLMVTFAVRLFDEDLTPVADDSYLRWFKNAENDHYTDKNVLVGGISALRL